MFIHIITLITYLSLHILKQILIIIFVLSNMCVLLLKLSTCKKERKDYEGQLQIMRNEIRQLKEQCQEKFNSAPKAMENQNQIAMQVNRR